MRETWAVTRRAGLALGPVLFFGSLALDVLSVAQLGLPFWSLQAIGAAVFAASAGSIIFDQRREIQALTRALDDRTQRRGARDQLARFVEQGDGLLQEIQKSAARVPEDRYETWNQATEAYLRATLGQAEAVRFASARQPSQAPARHGGYQTAVWDQLHRVAAQIEALRDLSDRLE